MPSFGLFRKQKKQQPPEQATAKVQETIAKDNNSEDTKIIPPENQISTADSVQPEIVPPEQAESSQTVVCKTYLKAMPLRDLADLEGMKAEIQNGNILILRITPLASKSIEAVKNAVSELYAFAESIDGDIARLGEERVVICPKNIRIWREKTPTKNEAIPTTAA